MKAPAFLLCCVSLLWVAPISGQESIAVEDPDLPRSLESGHFEALMGNSPFLRVLDLTETFALRGIAEIDGVPVATLFNRETKKSILVSASEANAEQMQLMEISNGADDFLIGISATIAVAGEQVELKFEPERIAPRPKNAGSSGRGPSSGGGSSEPKDGERRGPSKEDIARYQALPDEKKEKLREYIRQSMQKYPDMSREERGNLIRGAMTRLSDGGDISVEPAAAGGGTRPSGNPPTSSSNRGDRDRR